MKSIQLKTAVPGPRSREILSRRQKVVSAGVSIGKSQIVAQSAFGATITDVDGNRFLDFSGGIGCMNVGHSSEPVLEAAIEQMKRMQHSCFQVVMYESYIQLVEKLVSITPGKFEKKGALFNSGAEAVENAVKIARRHTKRQAIVCFDNAFHGRTLLTMSLTSKVKPYKDGFGPFAPEVYQAPFPILSRRPSGLSEAAYVEESIQRLHAFFKSTVSLDNTAAFIIEPILGEGGFYSVPLSFMKELEKLSQENGIVLIADEIQTGFARTGKMFACEHFGIEPDLITLAKSMSAGFPLSAVIGRSQIMDSVSPGGLGGTFGGNPISCAAALASIKEIESQGLCKRSESIGKKTKDFIVDLAKKFPVLVDVRGFGAMVAFDFVKKENDKTIPDKLKAEKFIESCAKMGLLALTAGVEGNVIRTLMPISISDVQLQEAFGVIAESLAEVCK